MVSKKVTITNLSGLHMGAAGKLCDEAVKYTDTEIKFKYKGDYEANAKSMLSVLGAGVMAGQEIEISCEGPEEEKALLALVELVESNFDEF
ncbi:MAG: HPr family phosphocarrier protein [Lachnospiraceae bacterium]|nr:HPr family phosphocarrier protein [Lachnospiraceae bacterium]